VAALTQDGAKYSDYMSALQDEFQNNVIEFVINRKFPKEATDLSMVGLNHLIYCANVGLIIVCQRP
jgi:hypothetical protein